MCEFQQRNWYLTRNVHERRVLRRGIHEETFSPNGILPRNKIMYYYVYVCMCVRKYVRVYVCIYVCVRMYVYLRMRVLCTFVSMHVCTMYVCVSMYVFFI